MPGLPASLQRGHVGGCAWNTSLPLGKMAARIDKLADDVQAASTSAQAKRLQKERDKLTRQLEELRR